MRFFFLIALVFSLFVAKSYATCGTCCSTGNCLTAFRGTEGICCGVKSVDDAFSKPYCCPSNAKCIDDNAGGFKCQLMNVDGAATRTAGTHTPPPVAKRSGLRWWQWVLIGLGALIAFSLISWGIYRLVNYYRYRNNDKIVIGHNNSSAPRHVDVRL